MRVFHEAAACGADSAALLARICAEVTSDGSPLADVERSSFSWAGLAWHVLHCGDRVALLGLPAEREEAFSAPPDVDERPIVEQLLRRGSETAAAFFPALRFGRGDESAS